MPFLAINSIDDPVAVLCKETIDRIKATVSKSKNLNVVITQTGGHLGWVKGGIKSIGWDDELVINFFEKLK